MADVQMVEYDTKLLEGTGSFCLRSKKDSLGYISKNKWLNERFEEGLSISRFLKEISKLVLLNTLTLRFSPESSMQPIIWKFIVYG
ncbi:hypothetical protein AADC60_04700 [Cytobacillus pseudoceanisediminis]|uniref:Uncharacterized protein n=1 Tax=Cytobacillus pseudoceanisediminis TaxID=3051614 RepID=A0ABZ2ZJY9_9BACI